jgi:hypothetical protein
MAKKDTPKFVMPTGGDYRLNQTAPIFNDRRTKRNRTRSIQNRNSIERSKEE